MKKIIVMQKDKSIIYEIEETLWWICSGDET